MKIEAADIRHEELIAAVNQHYGLRITALRFFPKGEDAYAYVAQDEDGAWYFVRAQPANRPGRLTEAYPVIAALRDRCGLAQVIAPFATQQGHFTVSFGAYTVAAFPFVAGRTLYEQGASEHDLQAAAQLLAAIHSSASCAGELRYKEAFDNPFAARILHALDLSPAAAASDDLYRREAGRLMRSERSDIMSTLELMDRFQAELQALPLDWLLTHGDPNLDNLLKDEAGVLHLSDWGEVGAGPAERDLSAFTGERFELFLRAYIAARGPIKLYPRLFGFYFYRWTMQEIADYSTRLLVSNTHPVEQEHAWDELQDYLPVRHAGIAESVERVAGVIAAVLGTEGVGSGAARP